LIIAVYKNEVDACFFSVNPGLRRRFTQVFEIERYTANDLVLLFLRRASKDGWRVENKKELKLLLAREVDSFKYFGGDIDAFFTECKFCHSLSALTSIFSNERKLTQEDIEKGLRCFLKSRSDTKDSQPLMMYS